MPNTLTISFRAKLAEFSGGKGYKVPKLNLNHLSTAERDSYAQAILNARPQDQDITDHRIGNLLGGRLPGVVWQDTERNDAPWTITPNNSGFMAVVTVTVPLSGRVMRGLEPATFTETSN